MATRKVLKWRVPIDDYPHQVGAGPVVQVGVQSNDPYAVMVWTDEVFDGQPKFGDRPKPDRTVRVYGTGHIVPPDAVHLGSCSYGGFVWHLFEEVTR